jgi:uncharacterized protein with PIN domain
MLGFDTAYPADVGDRELARLARTRGAVLLTRDTELAAARGVPTLLIRSDHLAQQLAQVGSELDIPLTPPSFGRCAECNEPLAPCERTAARDRVPEHVYYAHDEFAECPTCLRVYWRGSHWRSARQLLAGQSPESPLPDDAG